MYRKLIKGLCKLELSIVYCVVFPQPLCGGWGKRLAGVHMSLVLVPHPGNTDGEVFINF